MAMLAVAGIFPVTAFDWPLPRFRLESTFGSPRENYFQREIYLSTSEASIHSIAKGETVFFPERWEPLRVNANSKRKYACH